MNIAASVFGLPKCWTKGDQLTSPVALKTYSKKRDFTQTPEPQGNTHGDISGNAQGNTRAAQAAAMFCVQKHAASRLHYDFRLEIDGVLKSWAVPKGPSIDPGERRLAVETEDHPMSYATFEGEIPKGNYGAGKVIVWDIGTWQCLGSDPMKAYQAGKFKLRLHGRKLQGDWRLVKTRGSQWLLIKSKSGPVDPALINELSVLSGVAVEHAGEISHRETFDVAAYPKARKAPMLKGVAVQLASLTSELPKGPGWIYEPKLDGYRLIAQIGDNKTGRRRSADRDVTLLTRSGKDWTAKFPTIQIALAQMIKRPVVLDGEVVALDDEGRSDFGHLQEQLSTEQGDRLVFYVFDILYLDQWDLRGCSLRERKEILENLFGSLPSAVLRQVRYWETAGDDVLAVSCELGLEGVISKEVRGRYRPGRSTDWLKIKCQNRQELIVLGYTPREDSRRWFGALHLGYYKNGKISYAGKVGTGFGEQTFAEAEDHFAALETEQRPTLDKVPKEAGVWLQPKLVAEVSFANWTKQGRLRHPVFVAFRLDKDAREVHRDTVRIDTVRIDTVPLSAPPDLPSTVAGVHLSNPTKLLYPHSKISKSELATYYETLAPYILAELSKRPISVVRCPNGEGHECFFQRHIGNLDDKHILTVSDNNSEEDNRVKKEAVKDQSSEYIYVKSLAGVVSLVQAGTLELHSWAVRVDDIERPDLVIFDLDPGPGIDWSDIVEAAYLVREDLRQAGLHSFVKTTGKKGLHVYAPLTRRSSVEEVYRWSEAFARRLATGNGELFVDNMAKAKRRGRIFIDYHRNKRAATAIATFSTRATPSATVACPIAWSELKHCWPEELTVRSLPSLIGSDLLLLDRPNVRQSLTKAAMTYVGLT